MDEVNKGERLVSAQVVLRATSTTEASRKVMSEFTRAGFTVGALHAKNFSITAPADRFESYFQVKLESAPRGGVRVVNPDQPANFELPVAALPRIAAARVKTIVFTKPPDFGPFI